MYRELNLFQPWEQSIDRKCSTVVTFLFADCTQMMFSLSRFTVVQLCYNTDEGVVEFALKYEIIGKHVLYSKERIYSQEQQNRYTKLKNGGRRDAIPSKKEATDIILLCENVLW